MCVILSIYQKEKDKNIRDSLVEVIEELKQYNRDGVGIVALNFDDDKWCKIRDLRLFKSELRRILSSFDVVNIHLRMATSGEVKKEFVHFWQYGQWLFAHNGTIRDFERKDMCDSLIFFKEIIKRNYIQAGAKIKIDKIKRFVNSLRYFQGRFVICNKASKEIYYFGDFKVYSLDRKVLLISSSDKNISMANYFDFFGLRFKENNSIEVASKEIEGIYLMDLKEKRIKLLKGEFLKNSYYSLGFRYGNYGYEDYGYENYGYGSYKGI